MLFLPLFFHSSCQTLLCRVWHPKCPDFCTRGAWRCPLGQRLHTHDVLLCHGLRRAPLPAPSAWQRSVAVDAGQLAEFSFYSPQTMFSSKGLERRNQAVTGKR